MELKLYDSRAIAEMYDVTLQTARKYMKLMGCSGKPFRVTMKQIRAWNESRAKMPEDYEEAMKRYSKVQSMILRMKKGELI